MFELRRIIFMRPMGWINWDLIPSREPPSVSEGFSGVYREIASRDIDCARRRWLRTQVSPICGGSGPVTSNDNTVLQSPSGVEIAPELPEGALDS